MFDDIREDIIRKFLELKLWTSNIKELEPYAPVEKGLFFVYVYGIYEECIRSVVQRTIIELNSSETQINECIWELYSLILSDEYDGLYNVGNEKKWEKRWKISDKLEINPTIHISFQIMPTDGKNFRYKQLDSIAKTFGIRGEVLPRKELGGHIHTVVNNRNYIAHGNKLPKEIGGNYSLKDLLLMCDYFQEICLHTILIYETYICEKHFKRADSFNDNKE